MNKEEQKFTRLKNVIRLSKRLKKYRLRMVAAIAAGVGNQLSMVAASVLGAWTVGLAIDAGTELCDRGYDSSNYHPDCVLRVGNVDLPRCGI